MPRILLVDDDPNLLVLASEFLKGEDSQFEITPLPSAQDAMQHLEENPCDVIVCDYQLPDMDGLQLLEGLRRAGNTIPFIMFTGRGREEVAIRALNLGADYYLRKSGDPQSQYTELAHIIRSLVVHQQVEQALQESEERFRALADQSLTGIAILQAGKITYANKAAEALIGCSRAELQAWKAEEFAKAIHPDDRAAVMRRYRLRKSGNTKSAFQYDVRVITKAGEVKWLAVHSRAIDLPGSPAIAVSILDNTERQMTENALRESEEKYRSIVEQTHDGIALMDDQGSMVEWNRAQEEIFGLTRAEVLGRPIWDIQFQVTPKENQSQVLYDELKASVGRLLKTGEAPWLNQLLEIDIQRPDGARRTVQQLPFLIQSRESFMACSITRNITDLKRTEEVLQKKSEELSEFAHAMAHDLRGKLHNIKGFASLLQEKYDQTYVEKICTLADTMNNLLERSVALAEAGKVIEKIDRVDLAELMRTVAESTIPESIAFTLESLPAVVGDREKLAQAFQNLLENAVSHGKPNRIIVRCQEAMHGMDLVITNDGTPIPEEHWAKIFRRGFSTKEGRTGLGLVIVQKVIEAHGWQIQLDAASQTTFRIVIPHA
ncbi:MAG: PAS domain S-box protein [Candidatus Heimdallarchaeota archaeon]